MADIVGPMRPSDSWSTTEVRSLQHTHVWTVKGFSQCECRYLETTIRIKDAPTTMAADGNNRLIFRIRLHPQGNKESNKDFCFFQAFCNSNVAKYKAKFSVFNTRNEEIPATVYTGAQQLNGYFEYIRRDLLMSHIQPQDEIQLILNLTIIYDTVTKNSQSVPTNILPEPHITELAQDLETAFKEHRHSDFTIICSSDKERKEIPVHKIILSARSPVFAAMLESHTEEANTNKVVYEDIDYEVMVELLSYVYSGRSPNVQNMALELLAAADRFQLPGLKDMCDHVLRIGLQVETVCRNLVFADMHNAQELKLDAIKFIAGNSHQVIHTDGWTDMTKSHPQLVTEVVAAMSNDGSASTRSISQFNLGASSDTSPSAAKRIRLDHDVRNIGPPY